MGHVQLEVLESLIGTGRTLGDLAEWTGRDQRVLRASMQGLHSRGLVRRCKIRRNGPGRRPYRWSLTRKGMQEFRAQVATGRVPGVPR